MIARHSLMDLWLRSIMKQGTIHRPHHSLFWCGEWCGSCFQVQRNCRPAILSGESDCRSDRFNHWKQVRRCCWLWRNNSGNRFASSSFRCIAVIFFCWWVSDDKSRWGEPISRSIWPQRLYCLKNQADFLEPVSGEILLDFHSVQRTTF